MPGGIMPGGIIPGGIIPGGMPCGGKRGGIIPGGIMPGRGPPCCCQLGGGWPAMICLASACAASPLSDSAYDSPRTIAQSRARGTRPH